MTRHYYVPMLDGSGRQIRDFRIRALNESDLSYLWQAHEIAAEQSYQFYMDEYPDIDGVDVSAAALVAMREAPDLVADTLSIVSDQSTDIIKDRAGVLRLPYNVRATAFATVILMSFASEGGLGDLPKRKTKQADGPKRKPSKKPKGAPVATFMMDVRKAVSKLLDHGHRDAHQYPLGRIFLEADLIRDRTDREHADAAILMQKTVGSVIDEKIGREFVKYIKELAGDGE